MDLNEYIEWYEEHFHMRPSQKLIDKFISIHQPVKLKQESNDNNSNDAKISDSRNTSNE